MGPPRVYSQVYFFNSGDTVPRAISNASSSPAALNDYEVHTPRFGDANSGYKTFEMQNLPPPSHAYGVNNFLNDTESPWIPPQATGVTPPHRRNQYQQQQHGQVGRGSIHASGPHSDSGYGTRQSVSNFSANATDRDQDCQSQTGHMGESHQFQGFNEAFPTQEFGFPGPDTLGLEFPSSLNPNPELCCSVCQKYCKTPSEMK